jgi:pyrroline-5-carboxylate reductase
MIDNITFIGGGNMASAIIQGLLARGVAREKIDVVEPLADARARLKSSFGVQVHEEPGTWMNRAGVVVWAVKPQMFQQAAQQSRAFAGAALHLSVAAGIPSSSIVNWLRTARVVRAMPNTPALIGKGITALFAGPVITPQQRETIEQIISTTGELLWVEREDLLDAVTAISGSGPAYVYYFMEAMTSSAEAMGLTPAQAHQLTVSTFIGASELARASTEPPETLRQRVTSKGGTTHAAISSMEASGIGPAFQRALQAARDRAQAMGREFGSN